MPAGKAARRRASTAGARLALLTTGALLLAASATAASPSFKLAFLWDEVNAAMQRAQSPDDFLRAARKYQELVDNGARSGDLFYNYGTALLNAGRYDDALQLLRRAERHLGYRRDIVQNMGLALAGDDGEKTVPLPWYRIPLFWHFGLSAASRLTVAAAAFSLAWIALTLRRLGAKVLPTPLLTGSVIVCVLFASSVMTTAVEEAQEFRPDLESTVPSEDQARG